MISPRNPFRISLRAAAALAAFVCTLVSSGASAAEPTLAEMQWHRRVLLVSTPNTADPNFSKQILMLAQWRGGEDRDVSVVRLEGNSVSGTRDTAKELRGHYQLAADSFSATLIGKDGHVAMRSKTPLTGAQLEGVIDAMPMRKAGQR